MTRRRSMGRGTVLKIRGRYYVQTSHGFDANGKRIRRTHGGYLTKEDAERALTEINYRLDRGVSVDPSKRRLGEYLTEEWLPAKRATIRDNTFEVYSLYIEAYIVPMLGNSRLQQLTPGDLNAFYSELLASGGRRHQGLAPKTVRNVHTTLHKALVDAAKWGYVIRNAAEVADPPRVRRQEMKTWTSVHLANFLRMTAEDRLAVAWLVAASTGMRRSELLGLTWAAIDLQAQRLEVTGTVVLVGATPVFRRSEGKTASARRSVALDGHTVDALRVHRTRQLEERLAAGELWENRDLVFCREDGSLINPSWLTRRFGRLIEMVGVPKIRFHDLRHTHATLALRGGVPAKVVAERLGHTSVKVTLDTYSHVLPDMQRDAAETVARMVFGDPTG